jgi:ABC-type polysaccharide/polyol phosphate transport system ATPase subunit
MGRHAIEVERLGKRYWLGEHSPRYLTLRESLASVLGRGGDGNGGHRELWALRDVTFGVEEGEIVGVIGRNGAGKSTLLKILARITEPTTGVARMRGRVGALLEVGTGFHPELTGTENVYLNGAILGMTSSDIRRRFDEIVAFAGVEDFLDTPLKRYSSGMYLRLAFAVAAHLEPDIVVVDEVLAVGDSDFQRKCLGKMSEFGREGRTIVFVSHDLGAISRLCHRAYWIDHGVVQAEGPSAEIVEQYFRSAVRQLPRAEFPLDPERPVQLLWAAVTDEDGELLEAPRRDKEFVLTAGFVVRQRIPELDFAVYIRNRQGVQVMSENWSDIGMRPRPTVPQEYEVAVTIPPILAPGDYVMGVWIGTEHQSFVSQEAVGFHVGPRPDDTQSALERKRLIQPGVRWEVRPHASE